MELDDAFRYIGKFGRYQMFVYALMSFYCCWLSGFQLTGMIFVGYAPKTYYCTPPSGFLSNETTPVTETNDGTKEIDKCHMYDVTDDGNVTNNLTDCVYGWDYVSQSGEASLVTDFDLYCDKDIYAKAAQSVLMAGVLVGSVLSGHLSDYFGRKIVLHAALVLEALSGMAMALSWNYYLVVFFWFMVGIFNQGLLNSSYVLLSEIFPPEVRTMSTPIVGIIWGVAVTTFTPVAYLLPNWRHYELFVSLLCLIAIPMWWITPESPRWLISQGRIEEAEEILQKMAKVNKVKAPKSFLLENEGVPLTKTDCVTMVTDTSPTNHGYKPINKQYGGKMDKSINASIVGDLRHCTLLDVIKAPLLFRNLLVMGFNWFSTSIVYYGLSLNSATLSGNMYLNVFLSCMVELPASLMILLQKWVGRRPTLGVAFLMSGLCCVVTACLPKTNGKSISTAIIVVSTLGKFWISFAFNVIYFYTPEIMPTPVRTLCFGVCSMFARIGGIVAPFVIYLNNVTEYLPLNFLGVCAIFAAFVSQMLPETRNIPLPETFKDGIELAQDSLYNRCSRSADGYKEAEDDQKEQRNDV
ncbi:solute carrier family 22 member 15-like [Amphiura filiformis]|uniref:solute carrier family 22 member 15-like n=1 Tax=Amphiura filiformis TaxID=82378 RepID=UPI003B212DB6